MNGEIIAIAFPTPWPFWSEGLQLDRHGRLALAQLPYWPALTGTDEAAPGGLAVFDGRAYLACGDVIRVRECDGSYTSFGAVAAGSGLGEVRDPRGLAVSPLNTLIVADRGNDRIQEFDLHTGQLVWLWPGLMEPEDVAVDTSGRVYAASAGGVVLLDRGADAVQVASATDLGGRPRSIALAGGDEQGSLLYVAVGTWLPRIVVVNSATQRALNQVLARALGAGSPELPQPPPNIRGPLQLRTHGSRLYVASPADGAVRVIDTDLPVLLGDLPGPAPDFSAIALDENGRLWASNCEGAVGSPGTGSAAAGEARIGPIPLRLEPGAPHGLRLRTGGRLRPGQASIAATFTPAPGGADPVGSAPDAWIDIPDGTTAVTVRLRLTPPAANAGSTLKHYVELVELRIDEPGWIEQLPAIYRAKGDPAAFLDPYLRLLRTGSDDVNASLLQLPGEFDPATAVDDLEGERWLDWLATWVDVLLDERWDESTRRSMVSEAFRRHGVRGTRAGLEELIDAELGLDVTISEPGDLASIWLLGEGGAELGFTTMTGGGPASGSIVDVTAVADRSHLIGSADYGAPLFGDIAHRFHVFVHSAYLPCERDERRLRELVEREKPAHTIAHVCVVEPGITLGLKSRLDVNAVVGAEDDPRALGGLEGFARDRPGNRTAVGDHGPLVLR